MADQPTFRIEQLPKPSPGDENDPTWIALAEKFRALRLRSLQVAPEAFASKYEAESQRGLDQTLQRLSNRKARQFVAIEDFDVGERSLTGEEDLEGICRPDWIGIIVLLGPVECIVTAETDPFGTVESAADAATSDNVGRIRSPVKFVLNGVFVDPSARGRGIGKALIDTALENVKAHKDSGGTNVYVTVLVNASNEGARKLYQKSGFAVLGEEKYTQEPRSLLGEVQAAEKVALKMRSDML